MTEFVCNPQRALRQLIGGWQLAGLTHLKAVGAPQSPGEAVILETVQPPALGSTSPRPDPKGDEPAPRQEQAAMTASSLSVEQRQAELQALATTVSHCERCAELTSSRTQTVFGVGNPQAQVMFIGEAPGADEDAQGEPFVGRAGQLLNKIIEACGWTREELYICNILRCRPPGNRNPTPEEAANCREYLDGQIRLVDPDYIVCWGSVAAHNLLDESTAIGKLRQKWLRYGRARVLCTYHPSYLLRNPAAKKPVWEDMKFLLSEMGLEPPV